MVDVFDAKKDAIQTLVETGYDKQSFFIREKSLSYYHPGKSAEVIVKRHSLGSFGELHPKLMKKFQIKQQTVLGCLKINELMKNSSYNIKPSEFKPSPFLTLKKDFSFILPSSAKVGGLISVIKSSNDAIGEVLVFDIYNSIGKNDGKLSVGVEVEILQKDKVLNAKEINDIMHNIILQVKKEINAELRTQ